MTICLDCSKEIGKRSTRCLRCAAKARRTPGGVDFGGIYYRPKGRGKYWLGGSDGGSLHRAVWEASNGPIPPGWEVHHIDGDRNNNEISNLVCMRRTDHHDKHREVRESEEFRKQASTKRKEWWSKQPDVEGTCPECGRTFALKSPRAKVCSRGCQVRRNNRIQRTKRR